MNIPLYSITECEHIEFVAQRLDQVLHELVRHVRDCKQATTTDLEALARELLLERDLSPILPDQVSPVSQKPFGFVGSYSLNEELTHSPPCNRIIREGDAVSYTHLRAHETKANLV